MKLKIKKIKIENSIIFIIICLIQIILIKILKTYHMEQTKHKVKKTKKRC